ncbi:hypothetical protein JX266_011630 [Neoarthrinium moseri]|nr:hypothetical protein JX266_011630 [Neoarthrinium moseri]
MPKSKDLLAALLVGHVSQATDNYAWDATEKFFENLYGILDAQVTPRDGEDDTAPAKPTKALNIILENIRHGVPPNKDLYDVFKFLFFFSAPFGTASLCIENPILVTEARPLVSPS